MTDATSSTGAERGREAATPHKLPLRGWWEIGLRVKDELARDHVSVVAAGVAFFGLLAIFPAIVALISVAALILEPSEISAQLDAVLAALPGGAAEIISDQVNEVLSSDREAGWAFGIGLGLALFSAAKGMKSLIEGMNIAYDEQEERGFIHINLLALGLTLLAAAAMTIAMSITVILPPLFEPIGLGRTAQSAVEIARWPLLAVMMSVGLAVLFRFGPDRADAKWVWLSPGALLATILWVAGTAAFTVYVESFGSYNETYGSIGAVIILLTWFWMSAFIVMLGAELNAEAEHQTRIDTTTGAPLPLGERGATKADNVANAP